MSFDKPTRNLLANLVAECRRLLTADIRDQLQRVYGLQPDGADLSVASLQHLDKPGLEIAKDLRIWREHLAVTDHGTEQKRRIAAFERLAQETAFTSLNRLAALRLCEERGHLLECVRRGMESDGFALYERLCGGALGSRGEMYRQFLYRVFDEMAQDLGVLFDRRQPQSLVFPGERCLEDVLALLNDPALRHLWQEDETIGWIYQYYNSQEERRRMREESAAPQNSHELAVRNQFFTPRYVVEFLTDNTLGRIWYEMTKGTTSLKEKCRYLVRRPNEIFLNERQAAPLIPQQDEAPKKSQEELLKEPIYISHRSLKDPREIRLLDPACGSMHFGLYAFDLFEVIYEEVWDSYPNLLEDIRKSVTDKREFLLLVPKLIIEHNLHGIEIDPRCTQIAGLSLWLRAQKSWQRLGLKLAERPRIAKSNVVCAEPMPGEKELLGEFTARLESPAIGQLVEMAFDKMQLAGEAGSLLKIEQEISSIVAEAKAFWKQGPKYEQVKLFGKLPGKPEQQEFKLDLSGITDEQFWEKAEGRIYLALREYAEQAQNGIGYQRRLFADDAARGFAFIDLCRKRYDVVLMNPPFGEPAAGSVEYINRQYPNAFIDLLASFVERTIGLCPTGRIGALTSRACLYTKTLSEWRRHSFLPAIETVVDLGGGVLDGAMVFACASVFTTPVSNAYTCRAIDLRKSSDREAELLLALGELCGGFIGKTVYLKKRRQLAQINGARFLYNIPDAFWHWSNGSTTLLEAGGSARAGSTTYDDFRFLRLTWEVPVESVGWDKAWIFFSKGGYFETFYNDLHLMVNWFKGGREVGEFNRIGYNTDAQSKRASAFYRRPGITYPRRTVKGFAPRSLPEDCIFADKGPTIFAPEGTDMAFALGYWNSAPVRALVHLQVQAGSFETGVINTVPWLTSKTASNRIAVIANEAWRKKAEIYRFWEVDRGFVPPKLSQAHSLVQFSENLRGLWRRNTEDVISLCTRISDVVSESFSLPEIDMEPFEVSTEDHAIQDAFGISDKGAFGFYISQLTVGCAFGRWDLRFATGEKLPPELPDPFAALPVCPPGMLQNADGLPAGPGDVPTNYRFNISWPGILVDDPGHPEDIEHRIREVIEVIWKDRAAAIEQEVCGILSVESLRDYLRRPSGFFADHLKRYSKSRRQAPIYWPLSTASGLYTVWVYYHRLNDDFLYTVVNGFVTLKMIEVERHLVRIEGNLQTTTGREATKLREAFEEANSLLEELHDFKAEVLRIAALPYKPNLNDGVLITAAPLWKLFRLPKWRNDLKECWEQLEAGEYDWAHLAYSIWPERVREKCKKDRSLAIAHGLESLCEGTSTGENAKPRRKRKSKATAPAES